MPLYVNQSLLTIKLNTGTDITAATELKILFSRPDETKGEWVGYLDSNTNIAYDVQDGDLDQAGTWKFQSYVLIGGDKGYGEIVYNTVVANLD